jgi:hypothetical protein
MLKESRKILETAAELKMDEGMSKRDEKDGD